MRAYWCTAGFAIFYFLVILFNASGQDDYNILLFVASPPFWVTESYWLKQLLGYRLEPPLPLIMIGTWIFWIAVGYGMDWLIARRKAKRAD